MTTFFTADHHFGHVNILKYEDALRRNGFGRRFQTVEEMDEFLIDQWNATVSPGDTVYHLGDLAFKLRAIEEILPYLNGSIILIVGNHDPFFKRLTCAMPRMHKEAREDALRAGFSEIHVQLDIEIAGVGKVRLSHFPYWPSNEGGEPEYNLRHKENRPPQGDEALLLHGHIHSQWLVQTQPGLPPMLNVGIDMWGMRPVSEARILEQYQKGIRP
jgi:calcineurin-like phosphoesterase family protein